MRLRSLSLAVATALTASLAVLVGPAPAQAASSGVNDFTCTPSAAHPRPVVLLHGLGGNAEGNVGPLANSLAGQGYCAFMLTYGLRVPGIPVGGTIDIDESAREIGDFIDRVLTATKAAKVDIVGHSEGGFQSLYVPKVHGYAPKVGRVVALAPPAHGTTFGGLISVADATGLRLLVDQILPLGCPACDQLIRGGAAVQKLNTGPIAQPGVKYTIIATRTDLLVTPHESRLLGTEETAFVKEPGVTNYYVQDKCPFASGAPGELTNAPRLSAHPVGHIGLAYDSGVTTMVSNALDPATAKPVRCSFGLPF
ncbi:esterase/lipase family protein [Nocardioides speluncae]|uniref:esterase/lipase family protein n=1 Tax=Nocardioides speluncae TaxID=2670337 RepID=UPI000D68898F|nr:alpha/beta fold hydrolase [Nocardioides speluncae]